MKCPNRVIEIAKALLAKDPTQITQSDDDCRAFMRLVAAQVVFELGPGFGLKSAGVGRPQGPSQIAVCTEPVFGGFRIIDLGGTKDARILADPPFQEWRDQIFIRVDPVDHLAIKPAPAPVPWPSSPSEPDIAHVLDRLAALERAVDRLTDILPTLVGDVERLEDRRYVATLWGGIKVVSVPE